ncbi:hypothetical protein [Aeromicrobium sp. A1-2]|uniref:hypothetical protein n=1 Tax=Aeromicrobium sp. A1-2 TaxID=2107713 RepID=UPI0013C3186D|nr:hypothetical protein [Aeromicrobium sp. A1-2]
MDILTVVTLFALLLGACGSLARPVAWDGHGSRHAPSSHVAEAGSWLVQELQR